MIRIAECIADLKRTSGRNDKIQALKEYADVPGFKEVLKFIYNPYIRTGIAAAKLHRATGQVTLQEITYKDVIAHFTQNQTGSDADVAFAKAFILQFEGEAKKLALAMVTKNLKIGVSVKTLNTVFGADFIPVVGVMKGYNYNDYKDKVKGPFIVTEKLDGVRRLLVKENGKVSMYSSSGRLDEGLVDIENEAAFLPDNFVYDGELLAIGEFKDAIALRQATNSIANSKGSRTGLTFNIFDMVPVQEYNRSRSMQEARQRKLMIALLFGDTGYKHITTHKPPTEQYIEKSLRFIKAVPILGMASNEEEVLDFARPIWDKGYEGVMLNTLHGLYDQSRRSKDLLKVKLTKTYRLKVVDIEEGTGKNKGKVGALIVDYKGQRVGAGSGLSDTQREDWWESPSNIIDKYVEIESFGESTNQNGQVSLNCPIFKRVVGAE